MSRKTELEFVAAPSVERLAGLRSNLKGYTQEKIGAYDAETAAIFASIQGTEVGGIYGNFQWGWLTVEWLYMQEGERRKGYARQLLQGLEEEARNRSTKRARLYTAKFQGAIPFYLTQEYRVVFAREIQLPSGESDVEYILEKSL